MESCKTADLYFPSSYNQFVELYPLAFKLAQQLKVSVEKGEKSYTDTFEINAVTVEVRHLFCFVMAVY